MTRAEHLGTVPRVGGCRAIREQDWIVTLRELHGLTQRDVADELGIDHTYLSKIENRHAQPGVSTAARMAELYGQEKVRMLAHFGHIPGELSARATRDENFALLCWQIADYSDERVQELVACPPPTETGK